MTALIFLLQSGRVCRTASGTGSAWGGTVEDGRASWEIRIKMMPKYIRYGTILSSGKSQ